VTSYLPGDGCASQKGLQVQKALFEELGLGVSVATWHVARDGLRKPSTCSGSFSLTAPRNYHKCRTRSTACLSRCRVATEPHIVGRMSKAIFGVSSPHIVPL